MKTKVFAKKKVESDPVSTRSFASRSVPNPRFVIPSIDAWVRFHAPQMLTASAIKLVSVMVKWDQNLVNILPKRQQKWMNAQQQKTV